MNKKKKSLASLLSNIIKPITGPPPELSRGDEVRGRGEADEEDEVKRENQDLKMGN